MDRLPSAAQHPDNCRCAECMMFGPSATRLNAKLGLPPLLREKPCFGKANGCVGECCRPKKVKGGRAARRRHLAVVESGTPVPRAPRYAARLKDAA